MKEKLLVFTRKVGTEFAKHAPDIMTGIGAAGVVATAIFASGATLEAKKKLDELDENASTWDKIKAVVPCYIETAIIGGTSVGCIIGTRILDAKKEAALISACTVLAESKKDLQDGVINVLGEKKAEKMKDDIAKDKIKKTLEKNPEIIETGHGEQIFLDLWSGQLFKSDLQYIRKCINDENAELNFGTVVPINQLYRDWGIRSTKFGDAFGWDLNFTGLINEKIIPEWTDETHTITCTAIDWYNDPALVVHTD